MRKKLIIIVIFISIAILVFLSTQTGKEKTERTEISQEVGAKKFEISILKNDGTEINLENQKMIEKYNTVLVPMDIIFSEIFGKEYKKDEDCTLSYNDTTLEVKQTENIIKVPTPYDNTGENASYYCDYSVDVEIEEVDGVKYIPVYLIANISGIEAQIDGINVYDSDNFYNSMDALDSSKSEHDIMIKMGENNKTAVMPTKSKYIYRCRKRSIMERRSI